MLFGNLNYNFPILFFLCYSIYYYYKNKLQFMYFYLSAVMLFILLTIMDKIKAIKSTIEFEKWKKKKNIEKSIKKIINSI